MNTFNCTAINNLDDSDIIRFTVTAYTQAFAELLACDYVVLRLPGHHLDSVILSHESIESAALDVMCPYDNDSSYDG